MPTEPGHYWVQLDHSDELGPHWTTAQVRHNDLGYLVWTTVVYSSFAASLSTCGVDLSAPVVQWGPRIEPPTGGPPETRRELARELEWARSQRDYLLGPLSWEEAAAKDWHGAPRRTTRETETTSKPGDLDRMRFAFLGKRIDTQGLIAQSGLSVEAAQAALHTLLVRGEVTHTEGHTHDDGHFCTCLVLGGECPPLPLTHWYLHAEDADSLTESRLADDAEEGARETREGAS